MSENYRRKLIRLFSSTRVRSFNELLDLEHIPTQPNHLFRSNNFDDEWLLEWRKYIFNISDDEIVLRPFDGSYDFELLNISMLHILEVLSACSCLPPCVEVYEQVFKEHVENIAKSCGIEREYFSKFKTNFYNFIQLYAVRRDYIKNSGAEDIELNNEATSQFRASKDHLIFGKIVGDALGLHPSLGALLNPTGGIVGTNNSNMFLRSFAILPSFRKNGIIHDATGYLRYYHGIGPGYKYLDVGDIRGRITPFNGVFYNWRQPHILLSFWKYIKISVTQTKRNIMRSEMRPDVLRELVYIICINIIVLMLVYWLL